MVGFEHGGHRVVGGVRRHSAGPYVSPLIRKGFYFWACRVIGLRVVWLQSNIDRRIIVKRGWMRLRWVEVDTARSECTDVEGEPWNLSWKSSIATEKRQRWVVITAHTMLTMCWMCDVSTKHRIAISADVSNIRNFLRMSADVSNIRNFLRMSRINGC